MLSWGKWHASCFAWFINLLFIQDYQFSRKQSLHFFQWFTTGFWKVEEEYDPTQQAQSTIKKKCTSSCQPVGQKKECHGNNQIKCPAKSLFTTWCLSKISLSKYKETFCVICLSVKIKLFLFLPSSRLFFDTLFLTDI